MGEINHTLEVWSQPDIDHAADPEEFAEIPSTARDLRSERISGRTWGRGSESNSRRFAGVSEAGAHSWADMAAVALRTLNDAWGTRR